MDVLITLGDMGSLVNDLLAVVSLVGSSILLAGTLLRAPYGRNEKIKYWSFGGLFFASLSQLCMAITSTTPNEVGYFLRLQPWLVTAFCLLSFLMLLARKWVLWNRKHVAHA